MMLEALIFTFFLELGWIPDQGLYLPESQMEVRNVYYVDLDATVRYLVFWLQLGMKNYSWPSGWTAAGLSFWPARTDYRCSFGLTYGLLTIGLRHLCSHTVDPYRRVTDGVDGWYDELFLRITGVAK